MEEQVLLHDDELDEKTRHEVRDGPSTIQQSRPNSGSMSSLVRCLTSLASRMASRLRISKYNLPTDAISAPLLLRSFASLVFAVLLFLRPQYMRKGGLEPTKKAHITSYLDALRGWAAVIVFNHHYGKIWILNHDFLRILVHGRAMVDVFFVISGYVLSYRMLKLMRTQQAVPLLDTVVSSVFRRWIRLYGSAAVASFISMLLVEFGWTHRSRRQKNLALQLWDWGLDFGHFSNVFAHLDGYWSRNGLSNKYLDVLWTIPVEFRGSMVLFTFCVGVCKLSTRNRMLLCWFLMLLAWYWAVVYVALFLGGLFLADLSFTRHPERLGPHPSLPLDAKDVLEHPPRRQPVSEKVFYSATLICSLFLLSQPLDKLQNESWPWPFLESLIPNQYRGSPILEHWWLSIGSLLLVWALDSYPTLQTPLKWNISQYLGDLSFGVYVMHFPMIWTLWANILNPLRLSLFGDQMWSYALILFLNFWAVLWAADLFIRIDTRVVAFGKWTQTKFFTW